MSARTVPGPVHQAVGDGALIERSRTEPECFAEIFDRYAPAVHRYLSGASGPALRTDLPTGTDAMVRYLYRNSHGQNPPDQQAFITAGDLVREAYLPPAALAALWSATARIPGVATAHDEVDAAGRHGVAVVREFNGLRQELILDPVTYAFLGEREVVTRDQDGLIRGQILGSSASMRIAIVDRPGQLP